MAKLRLRTRVQQEKVVFAGTGELLPLPTFRLLVSLHFVAPDLTDKWKPSGQIDQLRRFDAVVDTGATLTNIPYEMWEPFASEIKWATTAPGENKIAVGATVLTYQLGRVMLAAMDNQNRWMKPVWTLARCWHYREKTPPPLLGLTSAFFTNSRRLRHQDTKKTTQQDTVPEWWLEDA